MIGGVALIALYFTGLSLQFSKYLQERLFEWMRCFKPCLARRELKHLVNVEARLSTSGSVSWISRIKEIERTIDCK